MLGLHKILIRFLPALALVACDEATRDGCGGTSKSHLKLIGGAVDTAELFKSVFVVDLNDSYCTALKVTDDLLLTAGHCAFKGDTSQLISGEVYVSNSVQPTAVEQTILKDVIVEPGFLACTKERKEFEECRKVEGGDLAFFRIQPFKNGQFEKAPKTTIRTSAPDSGSGLTLLGYGCEAKAQAENENFKPRRKWGTRQASDLYEGSGYGFLHSYFALRVPTNATDAAICPGDSGAPVFTQSNGNYEAVGVASFNLEDINGNGIIDGFTNIGHFKSFIESTVSNTTSGTGSSTESADSCR